MPEVSIKLELTNEEWANICADVYKLGGCVTETASGHIVRRPPSILPEITSSSPNIVASIKQFFQNNKSGITAGSFIAVSFAGCFFAYKGLKKRRAKRIQARINSAFEAYMVAICNGTLSTDIITDLSSALDKLGTRDNLNTIMHNPGILTFYSKLSEYTERLAKANNVSLPPIQGSNWDNDTNVVDIRQYLERQRFIIESAS